MIFTDYRIRNHSLLIIENYCISVLLSGTINCYFLNEKKIGILFSGGLKQFTRRTERDPESCAFFWN